ncbi:AMP-binding protein [Amycolatopsis australiensis]|uniref:Acetyl-CoA synthetase n=1 Tax=Amycolatopsis australiensis TaxID=546364 RepID=A0A1K1SPC2_9PSEU|nr:AMP-binding protein [Amycolatopsis australiensis]SFW86187.1 acetyl-CoA synthetase [Amycolatopsis australiensis]
MQPGTRDVPPVVDAWLAAYDTAEADAAHLLCDRHDAEAVAFTFVEPDLTSRDVTYGELADRSRRLATVLAGRGVARGDRVPVLMGKRPELVTTLLAIWRLGAVHVPLFTAFATGAIRMRVEASRARLVVTEPSQRAKLDPVPGIDVLETGEAFDRLLDAAEPLATSVAAGGHGTMLQLFTSGTTGKPKGVPVPVRALASFHCYLHYGLDVGEDDVFWNAADPGWAYGLYYGILAPLAAGRRNLLLTAGFTPESTVAVIEKFGVTNFTGAPTMYRALSKSGLARDLRLRRASSAGEPLTPEVVDWAREALGVEVRDHYGQTELGMVINNHWHPDVARPVKPGSMGQPMPGYAAGTVDGQIAVDVANSPLLWFTGYHEEPGKTAERFTADRRWYLTADSGRIDEDGYYFFTARNDDVILAAGYRIGPFDVESVLITHPAVADVAVVGRPDPEGVRGEVVEAFVVLGGEAEANDELARELQQLVRDKYSKHAYPRTVHFVDALPKTPSGKVQRYLLRQR